MTQQPITTAVMGNNLSTFLYMQDIVATPIIMFSLI